MKSTPASANKPEEAVAGMRSFIANVRAPPDDKRAPKSQTVTKELRTLKAVLNKAVECGELARNPVANVDAPTKLDSKTAPFFTVEELGLIYGAYCAVVNNGLGPQPDPVHARTWRLFANTGIRRTEGLIVRWNWVGREAMKILSTDEQRTKSGKWREIPLTDGAREALKELPRDGLRIAAHDPAVAFTRGNTRHSPSRHRGGQHSHVSSHVLFSPCHGRCSALDGAEAGRPLDKGCDRELSSAVTKIFKPRRPRD
jgi:integrase